jgi:hypothetical protein
VSCVLIKLGFTRGIRVEKSRMWRVGGDKDCRLPSFSLDSNLYMYTVGYNLRLVVMCVRTCAR